MNSPTFTKRAVTAIAVLFASVMPAEAQIRITEVAPWASGFSAVGADWFELTNIGASAVAVSGWKMDDGSNTFANAVALNGISSIGAGESVIFIETSSAATVDTFKSVWFGTNVPAGLQFGTYSGSGVSLGSTNDGITVFNAGGIAQASVSYGSSTAFLTFDNAAGLDASAITQLSAAGVNGAFLAANGGEIGSPGLISAVPEPETWAMLLAGLGLTGVALRRRN